SLGRVRRWWSPRAWGAGGAGVTGIPAMWGWHAGGWRMRWALDIVPFAPQVPYVDERLQREEAFHDEVFASDARKQVEGFYQIAASSREFYRERLATRCTEKDVLEYGCGQGSYAFFLAERGARVTGIDISKIGIEQARSSAKQKGLSGVRFAQMN